MLLAGWLGDSIVVFGSSRGVFGCGSLAIRTAGNGQIWTTKTATKVGDLSFPERSEQAGLVLANSGLFLS